MKTIVKGDLLILIPDSADEKAALARWKNGRDGSVLATVTIAGSGTSIQFVAPVGGEPAGGEPPAGPD